MKIRTFDKLPMRPSKEKEREDDLRSKIRARAWTLCLEGKEDFKRGINRRSSPYPVGSADRASWVWGWDWAYHNWEFEMKRKRALGDYSAWPQRWKGRDR